MVTEMCVLFFSALSGEKSKQLLLPFQGVKSNRDAVRCPDLPTSPSPSKGKWSMHPTTLLVP